MILTRLGNKKAIAHKITPHFPPHKIWVEPFFGAGGMFFHKQKAKYNIVNDLDSDVFNLFQVVLHQLTELRNAFYIMPEHSDLLNYWKKNEAITPLEKALRFLLLSNSTYLGKQDTLSYGLRQKNKNKFNLRYERTFDMLSDIKFNNCDFRKFFSSLSYTDVDYGKPSGERDNTLIYADPPYLDTVNTYNNIGTWTEKDVIDLMDCLEKTKCRYAMSEFNHPFILQQVKEHNLNVIIIGELRNLNKRSTEILITNYKPISPTLFN